MFNIEMWAEHGWLDLRVKNIRGGRPKPEGSSRTIRSMSRSWWRAIKPL